jgi:hypothetical protein
VSGVVGEYPRVDHADIEEQVRRAAAFCCGRCCRRSVTCSPEVSKGPSRSSEETVGRKYGGVSVVKRPIVRASEESLPKRRQR